MSKRTAYRDPVQYWSGYQTFLNRDSRDGIFPPEDTPQTSNENTTWKGQDSAPRKREKERPLPLPSSHPKNRQKDIGSFSYNKHKKEPRTLGEPGSERGHPTKYDYNMPTRRSLKAEGNPGSTPYIKEPQQKQKKQKGPSKVKSRQNYLRNRNKLRAINRKRWLKNRRDPNKKRQRKYYLQYPNRYKRKGFSPFTTPAERTRAWRKDQKKAGMWPADWNTQTKRTEAPEGTETTSLRVPNLGEKPQKGLYTNNINPEGGMPQKNRIQDQTNGSGKVFPRDSDLLNNKRVPKEEETHSRIEKWAFKVALRYIKSKG